MHTPRNPTSPRRFGPLLALLAAGALAGCDRHDDRTAGQKLDGAVASAERTGQDLKADAREAGRDMRQGVDNAGSKLAQKTRDLSITATVNSELARDDKLTAQPSTRP